MGGLKKQLLRELKNKLGTEDVLFWLDTDSLFLKTVLEMETSGEFPFPLVRFRGSFLEAIGEINGYLQKISVEKFLLYIEGVTGAEIEKSPFYETYLLAGQVRMDLSFLVRLELEGMVPPERIEGVLREGGGEFQRTEQLTERVKLGIHSAMPLLLEKSSVKQLGLDLLVNRSQLLKEGMTGIPLEDLKPYLGTHFGYESGEMDLDAYLFGFGRFLFLAEFLTDLKVELNTLKKMNQTPKQLENAKDVLRSLRKDHKEGYIHLEEKISYELEDVRHEIYDTYIRDGKNILGEIDTFEFEEKFLAEFCIAKIEKGNSSFALKTAEIRLKRMDGIEERSVWLSNGTREKLWLWIEKACLLELKITEVNRELPSLKDSNLEEFLRIYSGESGIWLVDSYFREMITEFNNLKMNFFGDERVSVLEENRKLCLKYVDVLNRMNSLFADACTKWGFLPQNPGLMQRNFYNQFVFPHLDKEKFVLIVVDALRLELGRKLYSELEKETYEKKVSMDAQYAELPTKTSVGMNVLFPLVGKDETLSPTFIEKDSVLSIRGFKVNQFSVSTIAERKRVLQEKSGNMCEWYALEDFHSIGAEEEEKIRSSKLFVLHSREIDEIGETNVNPAENVNYFDYTIQKIKSAIYKLTNLGFLHFVISSDHGFLFMGDTKPENTDTVPEGHGILLDRRYLYSTQEFQNDRYVRVSTRDLHYNTEKLGYFYFPKHISPLKKEEYQNFYHGGNSLQERIVPVLSMTVVKQYRTESIHQVQIKKIQYKESIDTLHRFEILLDAMENTLPFQRKIELELFSTQEGVSVQIKEVGNLQASENRFNVMVGRETEVFFTVYSERGDDVPLKVRFKDNKKQEQILDLEKSYKTIVRVRVPEIVSAESKKQMTLDPEIDRILIHIEKHGSITEQGILTIFPGREGSRVHRRFSIYIKQYQKDMPFEIEVEGQNHTEGTVYRKKV